MELNTSQGKEDDTYAHLNHRQRGKEAESKFSSDHGAIYAQCSQPTDGEVTKITCDRSNSRRRDRIKSFVLLVSLVLNVAAIAIAITAYREANSTSSLAGESEFSVRSPMEDEVNKTSGELSRAS